MLQNQFTQSAPRKLSTVSRFSEIHDVFTESAIRNLIFKADEREGANGKIPGNGLLEAGAILRVGRKVLIDEDRFFAWIDSQQATGPAKSGEVDKKSEYRDVCKEDRTALAKKAAAAKKGGIAPTSVELAGRA